MTPKELYAILRAEWVAGREEREAKMVDAPLIIRVAPSLDDAHVLAEYSRRPVMTIHSGHPVTIFPTGQVPRQP